MTSIHQLHEGVKPSPKGAHAVTRVAMVRPVGFGFNPETAATNIFAHAPEAGKNSPAEIERMSLAEFEGVLKRLREREITVLELEPRRTPATPDAVFPNNWFSTHAPTESCPHGAIVLYPMQAASRRLERRALFVEAIRQAQRKHHSEAHRHELDLPAVIDLSPMEEEGEYLEGTGSLILDSLNFVAYAGLSTRATRAAVDQWTQRMQAHGPWRAVIFEMSDQQSDIYHTNLVLSLGRSTAVLASEAITQSADRNRVHQELEASGRKVVELTRKQMHACSGNTLLLGKGEKAFWAMSQGAWLALKSDQREALSEDGELVALAIPTLESVGGGSVRCMLAELL